MAVQAPIIIKDHLDADVTFKPNGSRVTSPGKTTAIWKDRSGATSLDFLTLTEVHADPSAAGIEKFRYTLTQPHTVVDPVTGARKQSYFVAASVELFLPTQATAGEIERLSTMLRNLVGSAYFTNAVKEREPAW